ncbi:DUF6916 family protein [Sphingomonas koreensis]|nr:hypothetical protein [Sphingomonas koreensis]
MTADAVRGLTLGDFEGRIGTGFAIETELGTHTLELAVVEPMPQSTRPEGGFRLEFAGPPEPRLPQSIYRFVIDGAAHDIFIVAIGYRPEGGIRYEPTFPK